MTDGPSIYGAEFFAAWETFADEIKLVLRDGWPEAVERPIATKQSQYVLANMAIARLMRDVGQTETANHFVTLAEALQDVVEGINHPLFEVQKIDKHTAGKRGRKHDTSETWRVRSSLCIGVQFLIAGGLDQDAAVAFVIRKYRLQLTKLLRPGTDLKSSLPTWLKTFATDATNNDVALSNYKHGMTRLAEYRARQPQSDVRDFGEKLVAMAAADAANLVRI